MNNFELIRPNNLVKKLIIVDGQGRSGKNLIAVLLSAFPSVEKMRLDSQLDYIPRYHALGKLSTDAAIASLRTEVDEKFYYTLIGREVNLRFADYSSIWKQAQTAKYLPRLIGPDGQTALEKFEKLPTFQNMTHDGIQFASLWFDAFGDRLNIIHVLRNPVFNIFEQNRRGFGERLGIDPLEFQLSFDYEGSVLPLGAKGRESEYLDGSALEKLVVIVDQSFKLNSASIMSLPEEAKNRVLLIDFDDFVVTPEPTLKAISKLVGEAAPSRLNRILRRERVPRPRPDTRAMHESLSQQLSGHYRSVLDTLVSDYERAIAQLPIPRSS